MRTSRTAVTSTPSFIPKKRCAIYTRKSTDEGLDQEYNSLEAQRDAGLAFVSSQRHEGWLALDDTYDDGGFSGGNIDRPGLKRLMADIEARKIDVVVLNCCVTETNETLLRSNTSTSLAKSGRLRVSRSIL